MDNNSNNSDLDFQNYTVLIVDDHPINLRTLSDFLKTQGFQIMIARDGEGTIRIAQYAQPDIILLDVMLPGLDGFETCLQLKANDITKYIPVIFMTSLAEIEDKVQGFRVGGADYVVKPLQFEEVLARIVTQLRLQDLNRQLEQKVRKRTQALTLANQQLEQEIIERKRAEGEREKLITELEAKNTELEHFTYTVSHDLKSPLITVGSFLGMLEQDVMAGNTTRMKQDIQYIRDATEKMKHLLNDLLELSRIGRLVNPPQNISLYELAHEAVKLVAGQITERGVQVNIAPDLPNIFGDRPRILEVLQNLIDNAVKFMGHQAKPSIEIGVKSMNNEDIVCYVQDNGIGIDPRYQKKVFGLFQRLEPDINGTGIGLALVKRIIEVHDGQIWIESEGNGQGSTFYFTFKSTPPSKKES